MPAPRVESLRPGPSASSRPVTVCQILHTMNVGGAEMLAARLARRLRSECRFLFACLDEAGTLGIELRAEGFRVEVLDRSAGLDWRCAARLAQLLRRERVDLIHAHQYTPFFYAMMGRLLARKPPILFTEHGRHFPDYPRRKRMIANRLLLERRDRVVAVGNSVRQALINNEGFPGDRVEVIYNGIDETTFVKGDPDQADLRGQLGIGPGDLLVLMVARLDYLKDHGTALRTIQRLAAQAPRVRLLLAGEGPERGGIEAQIEELKLGNQVRLLGLRNDIPQLVRAADLFLLTSISEGIPLTVIEAMATSLPVVATKVGGLPEVVEDGITGFLAPSGDDAQLAKQILRLSDSPDLRQEMGRRGRQRAEAMFSESFMHDRYRQLYQAMVRS